jgi:GT2 family glycosyltransferase
MFDEVYYLASDDDDLGARAQAAGYRTVKLNIPVYHFEGGTVHTYSLNSAYLHMRNGIRFCLKNRSMARAVMRAARTFDLACNPWPFTFDADDTAHRRVRNSGNLLVNLRLWLRAVAWNIVRLPQTLRIRAVERRLIRAARIGRKDTVAVSQIAVGATPTGQLN